MTQSDDSDLTKPPLAPPPSTQRLVLRGLEIMAHVGVTPEERAKAQKLRIDVEVTLTPSAPKHDHLAETLDYGVLTRELRARVTGQRFRLLETLAGSLAARCLEDPRALDCTIRIEKIRRYDDLEALGVVMSWQREPGR